MVVHPSTGHQNPSYLPQFSPIYFHLIFPLHPLPNLHFPYILSIYSPSHPLFFVIKKFLSSPIPHNSEKKFFYMPVQIPRILYYLQSKNPLILSLNKYYLSRIILEISLQLSRENYFPELLNHHLTILTYYVIIYYGNRYRLAYGQYI